MSTSGKRKRLTQAERIAISNDNMLRAASELILEVGSANTTLKEVGERAGYSRGLASSRFGSKEALFLQLIIEHRKIWTDEINKHIEGKTGLDAMMARIQATEELVRQEPDEIKAIYTLWFESVGRTSVMREQLMTFHEETRRGIVEIVLHGVESGEFLQHVDAQQFSIDYLAQIFGSIYQWLISPDEINLSDSFDTLRALCVFALTTADPDYKQHKHN